MYDRDLIAGNMTGEPLGLLGAIDRGVFPGTDWRAVYEESLTAYVNDRRAKVDEAWQRLRVVTPDQPLRMDVPWVRDSEPVSWSDIVQMYRDAPGTWSTRFTVDPSAGW